MLNIRLFDFREICLISVEQYFLDRGNEMVHIVVVQLLTSIYSITMQWNVECVNSLLIDISGQMSLFQDVQGQGR